MSGDAGDGCGGGGGRWAGVWRGSLVVVVVCRRNKRRDVRCEAAAEAVV